MNKIKLKHKLINKINDWIGILWPIKICYVGSMLVIDFSSKKDGLFLFVNKIVHWIISLIIFLIFYKYDIQLLSEEVIDYIKIYLKISFISFIIITIYYYISGLYLLLVVEKEPKNLGQGILNTIKLINIIFNIFIFYKYFELTIELFLQYNIIFVINLLVTLILLLINIIFKKQLDAQKISSFLSYPFIGVIIIIIMILLRKSVKYGDWLINGVGMIYWDEIEK